MKFDKSIIVPAIIIAILVVGTAYFMSTRSQDTANTNTPSKITSFQECVDAGNPIMESYPEQCRTEDGQSFTQDIGNELEVADFIRSENPRPNQTISSPLQIIGEARGNWFFEASFPALLIDANGKEVAVIPVTAQGEWMTTNFVPYKATLTFAVPQTPTGTLVLKRDNPSGLPENDNELRIPIKFANYKAESTGNTTVRIFFNNSSMSAECENTLPVTREVAPTPAIARAALEQLITGLTQTEKDAGYSTLISPNVEINSLAILNGVAKIDFSSALEENSGGSCRALAVRSQITQTLKQFPTITDVVISVNGDTNILQP